MKTTITLLAASLILVGVPFAAADQTTNDTKADCGPNQAWIGYTSTAFLRDFYNNGLGKPAGLNTCEGEHWDGQDSVQPGQNPGSTAPCAGSDVQGPESFFVGLCRSPDPTSPASAFDTLTPVALRVSGKSGGAAYQEAYTAVDIFLVGQAVLYVGHCDAGASGLEGDSSCDGARQTRTGVYLRDNTPPNALATAVSAAGVTKGYVSEGDCDQATYEKGAYDPNPDTARTHCGRDNTAITIETLA